MNGLIINEELLQEIEFLQSVLKNNVGGAFGGLRRSKSYGSSCEFADYRDYVEGDDITKIDWNVYGRTEKLYQKLYWDERQMHTRIYIDVSRSMEYGDRRKAEQAIRLAAALAYISVCEMEKVSVYTVGEDRLHEVIMGMVGKEKYLTEIGKLNEVTFGGECGISDAVLPSKVGMGDGLSVIISDFLTDNDYESAIEHLVGKKRDVLCIQILSREEMNPQIRGKMHLFDSENPERYYRRNIDREIAKAYKAALKYSTDRIREYCEARGSAYILVNSEERVSEIILSKLVDLGALK